MNAQVLNDIINLSSGTIATLTHLKSTEEIDKVHEAFIKKAIKWLEIGALDPNDSWHKAWEMFLASVMFGGKPCSTR